MPSIEIICLHQAEPLIFKDLPFVVEAENKLVSHRSPSPLFQSDFDQLRGCIYHLCNPALREPDSQSCYTAFDLMNQDSQWYDHIQFDPKFVPAIKSLLWELITTSPKKNIIFTSDYQFGPNRRRFAKLRTLGDFWELHDQGKLWMNAMYYLK